MSEGNKTELPTPKKIEEAQKKGNFMFSDAVVTFVTTFVGVCLCYWLLADIPQRFDRMLVAALALAQYPDFGASVHNFFILLAKEVLVPTAILMGVVSLFGIMSNVVQVGFVFQGAKIHKGITFEQGINPIANAKNLFSKHTLTKLLTSTLKVIVVLWVVYHFIATDATLVDRAYSCRQDNLCGLWFAATLIGKLTLIALLACIPIVALDFGTTYLYYIKDNMMGKDEVEREHKETEGNPEVKGHRRQLANELVNGPDRIPNASAVVRNPTHIAVVLRYEPTSSPMPYIIEMADGERAQQIFRQAQRAGVPLYTNVPLARAMFAQAKVNEHVPLALSDKIVPFVYWLQNNHPERIYQQGEFTEILSRIGDVKR